MKTSAYINVGKGPIFGPPLQCPRQARRVMNQEDYIILEGYIDDLVDFATDIRKMEPTWTKE